MLRLLAKTVLLSLVTFNASAALVDNGNYTTDSNSGLDWLDFSATAGLSYDDALANNTGWRYATNAEVENLFAISFANYADTDATQHIAVDTSSTAAYSGILTDFATFSDLFGQSNPLDPQSGFYSVAFYQDEDDIFRAMGTYQDQGNGVTIVWSDESTQDLTNSSVYGSYYHGSYMVRSTVPVPAAVWLFGSALAGLGWLRRKRAA